jgi:hypothetical protein
MRNCLCIILFLVLSLALPATSVYAHSSGDGEGRDSGAGAGDSMFETESTTSDITKPPSGFEPATQENDGSEITTSSETDPGNEEEVAELVEEVNLLEEAAEEGEVEGDSKDSTEGTTSDTEEDVTEEAAEEGEVEGDSNDSAEGTTSDEKDTDESTSAEDQEDKKTEVATLVDDIDPHGSADESKTTEQPDPDQGLIGTQGTLPGTKSATLDKITEPEINEDGSVSTWAIYSNDTWVETTVNPDGTHEVAVVLDSGTVIRPGREYIHTGGSLNPALDAIITALEVTAAAGTVAGWVLTVTPAGALVSGGVKTAQAAWVTTTGIQAVRAGADAYAENINEGASQSEAIIEGAKQMSVNAVVVTGVGKYLGTPYEKGLGSLASSKTGKVAVEVAVKNYGNFAADGTTGNLTGYNPGYKPW